MTIGEADELLSLMGRSGDEHERRRHRSSTNRRGEMAGVIANAEAASQLNSDDLSRTIEAVAGLLQGNPP